MTDAEKCINAQHLGCLKAEGCEDCEQWISKPQMDQQSASNGLSCGCVEAKVETICDFIAAYEREKFRIMHDGGKLLSVTTFMLDYCTQLRASAT